MGLLRYILQCAFFLSPRGTRARRAPSHYLSRFLQNISNSISPPYQSQGEWPRLPFTARIERAQFHRARSASKKGTWPLPPILLRARVARAKETNGLPFLLLRWAGCEDEQRSTTGPTPQSTETGTRSPSSRNQSPSSKSIIFPR